MQLNLIWDDRTDGMPETWTPNTATSFWSAMMIWFRVEYSAPWALYFELRK